MSNIHCYDFDVVVVGGGPAGMAAAGVAAKGHRVAIVDENFGLGGQIWRGQSSTTATGNAEGRTIAEWYRRVQENEITHLAGLRVFASPLPGILHAEGPEGLYEIRYGKLILATGARERFLPFPGWTLRNVMGAGGLQAMVKSGLPIAGKRVVVAGSGPLLLAVAAYLHQHKAEVVAVCEQAPLNKLAGFALRLLGDPQKLKQGIEYRRQLGKTSYRAGWWPIEAHGNGRVETVVISKGDGIRELSCDYLACGYHLVPNTELAALLGCEIKNGSVVVDSLQQTSVPNILCAGESTGIGGLEKSLIEGEIAGLASIGHSDQAQPLLRKKEKSLRFAAAMDRTFALRPQLRNLPKADTLVCRCEDVRFERMQEHDCWRSAKLHTRCGMGACQGRVCGSAAEFLFGWNADSVRPPALPVRYGTIAAAFAAQESFQEE
jgi:D-hydroxyproline dehydrogenase subunit alpha